MSRRGGLGKGLGALIPTGPQAGSGAAPAVDLAELAASSVPSAARDAGTAGGPADSGGSGGGGSAGSGDPAGAPVAADTAVVSTATDAGPAAVPGASFREVPVDSIRANAKQPRQVFDEDAQDELKLSIKEFGLLQPVVVREVGDGAYELVMGERRWRATRDLGLETIPAIVRDTADDAMLRDALLENLHRAQLNPLEEAAAYRQLLDEFGTTHEELAQRIGRSRSQVTNTIRLLNLPVPVQRRVAAGVLSAGHARALLTLDDSDAQDALATRIVAEGLSVRAVEELVALTAHDKPAAARAASSRRVTAPALTDLADRLSDSFDTRVKVELGRRKGKIVVEFASVDDLERIVGLMAPGMGPRPNGLDHSGG